MTYALWELARRPEIQQRLREEVTVTYEAIRARGKEGFTPGDIDNMSYTNAFVKVSQPPPSEL
jgi:cytochrome P450